MMAKQKATTPSERTPLHVLVAIVLVALVLLQGGFQPVATCVVSAVAVVVVACMVCLRRMSVRITLPFVLLAALGIIETVSAFANGASAGALIKALEWFGMAGLMLLLSCEDEYDIRFSEGYGAIDAVCWAGIALSVLGCAMFTQLLPVGAAMDGGRLQFTFQYANVAGIFFAVIAILCANREDALLRWLAALPVLAMLLTKSMGVLAVFALAALAFTVACFVLKDVARVSVFLIQVLAAGVAFACGQVLPALVLLWAVVFCVHAWFAVKRLCVDILPKYVFRLSSPARVGALLAIAVVAAATVLLFLMPDRVAQAQQTFIERTIQMQDALQVLFSSALLGIGPGEWGSLYPFVQSAQYQASTVHCAYLQIALDAGIIGLLVFMVFVVAGVVRTIHSKDAALTIASLMIALHAVVDFDFEFSSLVFCMAIMFFASDATGRKSSREGIAQKLAVGFELPLQLQAASCVLCAVLCVLAIGLGAWKSSIVNAGWAGDYSALQAVNESALLANDGDACNAACAAIFQNPLAQDIDAFAARHQRLNATQTMLLGRAYLELGNPEKASEILLKALEEQPYNTALFGEVASYLDPKALAPSTLQRWRQAVQRANQLATSANAAKLSNQKAVELP